MKSHPVNKKIRFVISRNISYYDSCMKETFTRLPSEKKEKIIQACIAEFGTHGYDKCSTDRIIKTAGISKGGLYEYISSKEDLFLYVVEYSYSELYRYLKKRIEDQESEPPKDILKRIYLVSSFAIDFYLSSPQFIALITKTHMLEDQDLTTRINSHFISQFMEIFGDIDSDSLKYPKERILDLFGWLLRKTRHEFLQNLEKSPGDIEAVRSHYMSNWEFYISVLSDGIYKTPGNLS